MPLSATPELHAGICVFRPTGTSTLVEAVDFISDCVRHCRERGLRKLLVVGTGVDGVSVPSLVDRFLAVEEWARASNGMVAVVLAVQPHLIHPEKFGVKVAADLGLTYDITTDEAIALAWLERFE